MLEKDIENLIARYPEEFFPGQGFKLKGQQINIAGRIADIVFFDKHERMVIIEVKKGILSREAAGQIIEYYGLFKESFPERIIELILCANSIPFERRRFLENVGIECKELGLSLIQNIATKYNYEFLDENKSNKEKMDKTLSPNSDFLKKNHLRKIWIFQTNPRRYDILNALSEIDEFAWQVNRFKEEIKKGDIAIIWMSNTEYKNKDGGIYALGEIFSNPEIINDLPGEEKFWVSDEDKNKKDLRVIIKIKERFVNHPLLREELKSIPELKNMSIFRQPQGTNFQVTDDEWSVISKLIQDRSNTK